MTVSAELVLRSGDRKGELVEFSRRRRFDRAFREAFACRFGEVDTVDEERFINFLDFFVLQHRLPDGRTVVEHFVAEHPELPEEARAMLLGWRDVVEGIFRVQRRDRDALVTVNVVDELTYRVRSNRGPRGRSPHRG
jgi:cupin superfamily acireductone dioxygenase involved in methionine salvage